MPRTSFTPQVHGFHFSNKFVNTVALAPTLSITTRGRCGGMAFDALDCYFAQIAIPNVKGSDFPNGGVPPDGHPIADFIYARLMQSFLLNGLTFISWTQALDHQTWLRGRGIIRETKLIEIPKLRSQIDAGIPVAMGLIVAGPEDYALTKIGDNHQVIAYGYDVVGSTITIYIYDNNYPDQEKTLTTDLSDMGSYVTHTNGSQWRGIFVETYSYLYPAALVSIQNDWRWCQKCSGLFWAGGQAASGRCPVGGSHDRGTSGDYTLTHNSPNASGQNDWRWCQKCSGLFWAGGASAVGVCSAGGHHDRGGSGDYTLPHNSPGSPGQNDWRWCSQCSGLFWAGGDTAKGRCPAGNSHDRGTSGDYTLSHSMSS